MNNKYSRIKFWIRGGQQVDRGSVEQKKLIITSISRNTGWPPNVIYDLCGNFITRKWMTSLNNTTW